MHFVLHWLPILAIGAGVGFLGGLFGKGGSAIATPMLAAVGVPPIVAVAAPLPAFAESALLSWKDLDLSSDAGRAELNHRIDLAANRACTPALVTGSRLRSAPSAACVADARTQIQAKLAAKLPKTIDFAAADSGKSASR